MRNFCMKNLYIRNLYALYILLLCTMCEKDFHEVFLCQPFQKSQAHCLFVSHSLTASTSFMEPDRRGVKRKGGLQQRLRRTQEDLEKESALESLLMTYLAQGILSAAIIHGIAVAAAKDIQATKDGFTLPAIDRIANVTFGRNVKTSIYRRLQRKSDLPSPFTVNIPFKDGSHPSGILLPHELFAALYRHPGFWKVAMVPDDGKLPELWNAIQEHPALKDHPIKSKLGWRTYGVPLVLHGDEVPVVGVGKIWSRSSLCFSYCSLLANALGGTMDDIQLYCWSVFEKFCVASTQNLLGTMDTFFKILQWSFEAMYMGVWPAADWTGRRYHHSTRAGRKAGTPLAGGYFGVLLQLSGDLDYFTKWLGLPQSTTHSKPCALCRAQYSGANSWLDNRPGSPWQQTVLTANDWQTWWTTRCSLFQLPGMSAMSVALDLMHNLYLGWLQYFFGSVFWLLCYECLDLDPLSNLRTVWNFIKEMQQSDGTRHKYRHRLDKLSMFVKKTGFPKLKGRASDIRGLDKALLSCWQQFMSPENMQHKQVAAFLQLLLEVNDTLNNFSPKYGFWTVPQEHWQTLKQKACAMAQLHAQLSEHYSGLGVSLFNITSKTHFTLHSLFLAKDLHPSLTWCFKGESMMKKMQRVFKSCLAANKHFNVGRMSAVKFRHLLYIKIKERSD